MKPWEMDLEVVNENSTNSNTLMPWEMDLEVVEQPDFSKAKPNNIFSTDGLNTNAPQRADSWWQSVKNAYNEHMNEHWAEVDRRTKKREQFAKKVASYGEVTGKSAASGMVYTAGGAGSMINWYGDNMIISDESAELLGLEKKTQDRLNTFGRVWQKAGSSIRKFADYTKASELKLDDKIFEGEIWENPSVERFLALYGSLVPSMVSMAGLSKLTGSKAFTYITMGGLSAGEIYEEAKKKGLDLERTNLLYTTTWATQSLLERLFDPIANVFDAKVLGNSIPKQIAKRVFSGMMESGTEFSQTLSQNAIKKYGGIDETQDLMEGVIESMIGGFIGGGVFSGAFNERNQALLDKGMSQDEINAVIDEAGRYVSGHADEINDFAFQKITEGLSTFEEFIKTHAGTPEAQKAIQTKKDLEFVGEQVYDMLKKAGRTEESAKKESQIIQGISLWGAEETGLSPVEFIKQRFPEVKQMKLKDFQEQFAQKKQRADLKNVNLFEAVLNPKMRDEIAKAEKAERGLSLIQFIKQRGGLKDVDGDLKAMDAGKMQIGLINNKGGQELDDIALAAWENGYFPDKMERPDIDELKSAIRDELFGEKKYAFQQGKESVLKDIEELEAALDMLDIDYSNMSASELEAVYNEAVNEYNASNKVTFEENESIDDEDYIPFQGSEGENVVGEIPQKEDFENPTKDYELPHLNKSDLAKLGKQDKPVVLKKNIIIKNKTNHPEVSIDDYHKILRDTLINTTEIIQAQPKKKPDYYTFVNEKNDDISVVELSENKDNYEVVNFFKVNKKRIEAYRKKAIKDGGEIVITERKTQGAARLSALHDSYNSIISQTDRGVKPQFQSAFHGTQHKELAGGHFSLEKIGSGEGHQVHGYGLYYAADFDIADKRYRERLASGNWSLRIGDKTYAPNSLEAKAYAMYVVGNKDIDSVLSSYKDLMEVFSEKDAPEDYANYKREYDFLVENKDLLNTAEQITPKGQTYEVDIPENPYLLDEQKYFGDQPEFVQQALKRLYDDLVDVVANKISEEHRQEAINALVNGEKEENLTLDELDKSGYFSLKGLRNSKYTEGKWIYKRLSEILGSDKIASQTLEKYGIKGITYEGAIDGRCFVIFNPKDVKIIQKFYQNANDPRGAYYKDIIYLFEKANASTFMHETAHWFKEELKKFGSEKSAMMLKKVEEWENSELARRYTVDFKDGYFVVKNKRGSVVYDQGFKTDQAAKDYAKEEIFAQGFEAYLKEGKAPNNYLKNAFKSFWNWLRHIYKSAKALNVELNDNIRGVYGNILGGMDLDFYLDAPSLESIQHRQVMSKQREEYILDTIKEAQAMERNRTRLPFANFRQERAESKKDGVRFWGKAMIPISTRAKRISPKLRNKLRGYDFNVLQEQKRQYEQVLPFYDKWKLMSQDDAVAFDLALKNGLGKVQEAIVRKYDADKEFKAVRDLLEEIYERAEGVGIDMGHQKDYFPREISDLDGLMTHLHGSEMASDFRRAAKEAGFRAMTDEEKASFINKYLRGYNRMDLVTPPPGNVKDRRIDVIDAELNQFYKPSSQALFSYIDRMTNTIESRKFFGKDEEKIEDSIGAFVDEMIENGEIRASQDKEVEDILKARFKQKGVSNKFLIYQRNMSYLYTMGGINSAITQLSDLSVAMYKGGVWNTAKAIFGPKAPELTREALGLEKIGQEFVDASTSSKAVEKIFKLTGLDKIDAFGKNILMQASYLKFKDMAIKNPAKLKELIEPIMEQNTGETVADLAEGKITPNVQFLMFNELADVQPITLSEMPEGYLVGGNYRSLYMLKTFMVKRIDTFRNECFDKIRSGQPEEVKKGLQNLFSLAMLMMLCGAAKDTLIDLLYGRRINVTDMVVNNALGLFGITKYQLYKARDDGWGGFASSFIPPVFAVWSDLGRDMSDDFLTAKGKDLKDYEVLKGIPLVGRFYYWWFGGGRTKEEKKKKKKLK